MILYGSSRLGIWNRNTDVVSPPTGEITNFERGNKFFELSNHLGNVLVTVSDRKLQVSAGGVNVDYYTADVVSATDYYPGGMSMPGRKYEQAGSSYRFSINGQEKTPEIAANTTTAEFWQYDARIVRRWNVDPVVKIWESPYATFSNNPILLSDPNGADAGGGDEPVTTKKTNLENVTIRVKPPKEGTKRKVPYDGFLSKTFSIPIPSFRVTNNVNPADKISIIKDISIERYHRGSKYFSAGWYEDNESWIDVGATDYELTQIDWANGQVMNPLDWRNDVDGFVGIFTRGEISIGKTTRSWNGYEVDSKGYLTGAIIPIPPQEIGVNPVKITRFLSSLSKLMMSPTGRGYVLTKIRESKLKNVLNDLYRPNARVGNGSSMAAYRLERATGGLVGGKSHAIKLLNYKSALQKILKGNLNNFDKRTATELLNDITNALKGH